MITRAQIDDLRDGDIVRVSWQYGAAEHTVEGPVCLRNGAVHLASSMVLGTELGTERGEPWPGEHRRLTVVKRAPRPFYTNCDREGPVIGDVATTTSQLDDSPRVGVAPSTWAYTAQGWMSTTTGRPIGDPLHGMPAGSSVLLLNGTTGKAAL